MRKFVNIRSVESAVFSYERRVRDWLPRLNTPFIPPGDPVTPIGASPNITVSTAGGYTG
ncbi:hypothetical protein AArcCO_2546 [Halalkaliarchaeum sp. AArc-CO]|nr:hypothetical protein AArcCO_2546 [Halalkaliarchaeum sp. AArc-CO]